MGKQQPLKINTDTGDLERFTNSDNLPNQEDINETRELLALLVFELTAKGFPIQNTKLLNLLNEL